MIANKQLNHENFNSNKKNTSYASNKRKRLTDPYQQLIQTPLPQQFPHHLKCNLY
jgi:hypothetical protein